MRVTRTVFDMKTFDTVLVGKDVAFTPLPKDANIEQILASVGNDVNKLRSLVDVGREDETRQASYKSNDGWHSFKGDDPNPMDELNGAFEGTIADPSAVNEIVRTMAKTVFGYDPSMPADKKKEIKEKARQFVRDNEQIRSGLQSAQVK